MGYTVKFGEGNFSFLLTTLLSMVQAEAFWIYKSVLSSSTNIDKNIIT